MKTPEQEWQDEQRRVDQVVHIIEERVSSLEEQVGVIKADIVDIRKNFWEDVTVNFDDHHEAAETYASLRQQAEVLSERERSHRHSQNQLKTLIRLKQSPYFGRIDFREGHETDPIYLGIASLLDESEMNFLVYDWRAPVASMYYDYPPGKAQYLTPDGIISGEIELKRQYIIRDGKIRGMFDTGVTIGDELLQEVLGNQADTQMKSIVATIQKEQNQIIRNERSRLLIVQGAAGSGKTSSALQRIAYLLYRYRETLRSDQIVLFSPNPLFNSYVSTVLPELGEENMLQTTFQEYLELRIGRGFEVEDPFNQLEYTHTTMNKSGYPARMNGIAYKASLDFLNMMERYLESLAQKELIFKDLMFREQTLVSAQRIHEQFYSYDTSIPISNRMQLVVKWLLTELKELSRLERKKPWVEDEVELMDQDDFHEVYQELRKRKRHDGITFDDFALEQKLLSSMVVEKHFNPLRASVKRLDFIDIPAIYRQMFTNTDDFYSDEGDHLPSLWKEICDQTLENLNRNLLAYEDATPYLYLKERIEGFKTNHSVKHVFIDEAQDYSPFQFAFLKKLFPNSKMTLLGDFNQAIFAHANVQADLTHFASLGEPTSTEVVVLNQSYRSTRQIVEFTRGLIEGGSTIVPFNRNGVKPTVALVPDPSALAAQINERIQTLQQSGYRTIAIICKTAQESQQAYEELKDYFPLRLIGKETVSFEPGIVVIPTYLAKGVEFDGVIIYDASEQVYGREHERKLFYTACTRAMHELHVFSSDDISPFISALDPDTYVLTTC
ncbi:RNA polymerase recycling motor HelD [Brevibacillus ginsengisoli]|uniref:RNA polymerase recycling motor HelD n=1 Tax=Brevibacillus ginsengisoli TaxID=363854 RepID=UPI003CE6F595